jgi:hypothetical protein
VITFLRTVLGFTILFLGVLLAIPLLIFMTIMLFFGMFVFIL